MSITLDCLSSLATGVLLIACGSSAPAAATGSGGAGAAGSTAGPGPITASSGASVASSVSGSNANSASASSSSGGIPPGNIIPAMSCSGADVQSAIDSAANGDTVALPAPCNVTWADPVTMPDSKGLTLDGQGAIIVGHVDLDQNDATSSRITGFEFDNDTAISTSGNKASAPFRIDHMTLTIHASGTLIQVDGNAPGLIDNCKLNAPQNSEMIHNMGMGAVDDSGWHDDIVPGSPDALYVEDNVFTNNDVSGDPAYFWGNSSIQSYYGARSVIRHNTMLMSQIDQHGTSGMIGARWWEIYENTFSTDVPNASQCCFITLRAGSGVVFDNHHVGANAGGGSIDLYEEDTGYPADYQIGRGKDEASDPAYVWNNDAFFDVGSQTPDMVQAKRDYFLSPKPGYVPYAYPHPLRGGN